MRGKFHCKFTYIPLVAGIDTSSIAITYQKIAGWDGKTISVETNMQSPHTRYSYFTLNIIMVITIQHYNAFFVGGIMQASSYSQAFTLAGLPVSILC